MGIIGYPQSTKGLGFLFRELVVLHLIYSLFLRQLKVYFRNDQTQKAETIAYLEKVIQVGEGCMKAISLQDHCSSCNVYSTAKGLGNHKSKVIMEVEKARLQLASILQQK